MSVEVWDLWLRTYGARGAIDLARSSGFSDADILRVNSEAREAELRSAEKSEEPTP